jgi:DUF4097 and DUF4098 domain-containing protein YvlB
MQYDYTATDPQNVFVQLHAGSLVVDATGYPDSGVRVDVTGAGAEDVHVAQDGDTVTVTAPKRTGFFSRQDVHVQVTAPAGAHLVSQCGSADVTATGALGSVRVATGSGDVDLDRVDGSVSVKTGSGDVRIGSVGGEADLQTGSGDIAVRQVQGSSRMATGSGDISVQEGAPGLLLKSGSGDLEVVRAEGDAALKTASGDVVVRTMVRGAARLENVSGDIRLGVPSGTPVWTDCSTVTGRLISDLVSVGAPAEGQDYVEVRAKTMTGDIRLSHL